MSEIVLFDYGQLDVETRITVKQRTEEIKTLVRRSAQDIIDIGNKLIDVKQRLGHGSFGEWLEQEFQWSESTALRFMQVGHYFKSITVTDLSIQAKALYLLAAPSTPEPARLEAIERAEAGETITHTVAKQIVSQHRTPPPPPTHTLEASVPKSESANEANDLTTDKKIFQLSRWLIDRGWAIMSAPMPQQCYVSKGSTKFTFRNREDKQGELQALLQAKTYEETPAFTPPVIEPEPRRPATPPSRPLSDEEVEVVIWRAIRANARFPDKAESQLYWLKYATPGDFSRLLNPGVSFEAEQLARIKGNIEAELSKQATPPAEEMDSNEWYTPSYILMPARKALGSIDLDPASCATANEVVKATTYYDKAANGLLHPWRGNVWLNPPYSDPLPWIEKLLSEYMAGQVITALVLVNTANSPQWAQLLWSNTQASVCMLNCRIKFWRPDRPEGKGGDRDQMLWWVGPTAHPNSHERFRRAFEGFGPFR